MAAHILGITIDLYATRMTSPDSSVGSSAYAPRRTLAKPSASVATMSTSHVPSSRIRAITIDSTAGPPETGTLANSAPSDANVVASPTASVDTGRDANSEKP